MFGPRGSASADPPPPEEAPCELHMAHACPWELSRRGVNLGASPQPHLQVEEGQNCSEHFKPQADPRLAQCLLTKSLNYEPQDVEVLALGYLPEGEAETAKAPPATGLTVWSSSTGSLEATTSPQHRSALPRLPSSMGKQEVSVAAVMA
ncbi:hypothetical protein BaRGS_00027643 [Batillaria attramentaria]|uniref:Uncharacterized protein n=1 Tax=Batillaria attramentaria TaxID=370345 RepID=A0ABD0K2C5_9CAEN